MATSQQTIAEAIAKHGNVWIPQTNEDMKNVYEDLHAEKIAIYERTVKVGKGLKYGPSDRHRIDLYSPISESETGKYLPVVVFFHGGGFVMGDNDITPAMHGHMGRYFASNGCVCALATYRLLPEARYPSGAQDVTQALKWLHENVEKFNGDTSNITAVGQSAGGAHLATAIFTGILKDADIILKGTVLLSPPMWYDLTQPGRRKNMFAYHATEIEAEVLAKASFATFRNATERDMHACGNRVLLMLAEFDSNEIVDGNFMFVNEWRRKFKRLPLLEVLKGHNHISYALGIGLEGDVVGPRILGFMGEK